MEKMTEFFLQHMWMLWIFIATAFFFVRTVLWLLYSYVLRNGCYYQHFCSSV